MPAQDLTAAIAAQDAMRDADRQFVIFLSSIFMAVGITVASLVIAACHP